MSDNWSSRWDERAESDDGRRTLSKSVTFTVSADDALELNPFLWLPHTLPPPVAWISSVETALPVEPWSSLLNPLSKPPPPFCFFSFSSPELVGEASLYLLLPLPPS